MYVPKHFKEDDIKTLQQYIRDYSFGVLIVADENGIDANHVPFHLSCDESAVETSGSAGVLQCHVARSNPVWQKLAHAPLVLVVFQGPDAYVSPSWYATKSETGKVVPTWNYLAVHAKGRARAVQDPLWLRRHLGQLTTQQEAIMSEPWSLEDAPSDYTSRLMQAIVGIEIEIISLTGKLKASQNQPERNKAGVKAGLEAEGEKHRQGMAGFIQLAPV